MRKILLLLDYRNGFYSSMKNKKTFNSMDVSRIVSYFKGAAIHVDVKHFYEIDLGIDYRGCTVLYTSSEDVNSFYKSYIEDIVLALEARGAILIPGFTFLRAHHNKTMMEALRYSLFPGDAKRLNTRLYGSYEELAMDAGVDDGKWPKVIKSAFGAGSKNVALANNIQELQKIAKQISSSLSLEEAVREFGKRLLRKNYVPKSLNRQKFIVQNFVNNMDGDFKVLRYGKRFYVLFRKSRKGDFRSSGSGLFSFQIPNAVNQNALLDYAKRASDTIGSPLCSMDIGFDGTEFHLIEYQCLNFGTLTAEKSPHFYSQEEGRWALTEHACDLEQVFCEAIGEYLARQARYADLRIA